MIGCSIFAFRRIVLVLAERGIRWCACPIRRGTPLAGNVFFLRRELIKLFSNHVSDLIGLANTASVQRCCKDQMEGLLAAQIGDRDSILRDLLRRAALIDAPASRLGSHAAGTASRHEPAWGHTRRKPRRWLDACRGCTSNRLEPQHNPASHQVRTH